MPLVSSLLTTRTAMLLAVFSERMMVTRGFVACRGQHRPIWTSLFAASVKEENDPGLVSGLEIVRYPHPALRAENVEVEDFEEAGKLARRMFDLMYEADGVGLAAPQVGINKRLMVFNPEGKKERWLDEVILINPRIVDSAEGSVNDVEGCLSFPEMSGHVSRSKWIKVEALNPKGKTIKKKYTGWIARIFQHEYDHLDGVVYVDRLEPHEREQIQPKLDDLIQAHDEKTHGPPAL